ncbi:MAG: cysteine desulfurase family protein [Bacteroidia bacterium]|nr:cysteine desulfurase family protein [Bacteroidia bacterium]
MRRIYLDNAASTPMDPEVFECMKPWMLEFAGNPSSTHSHGRHIRNAIEQARRTIAGHLGAHPHEIYFTSGGTEADNMAIHAAVTAGGARHIITTSIEHHAVTHPVEHLVHTGAVSVTWLPVDCEGHISLDDLREALATHPHSLVSLMHGNNEIGTLHDIQAIAELCQQYGAYFHSDTVQTMGTSRFNLAETPIHFLTASAHKFYGPKGVGFLYIRKGTPVSPLISGGGQERNLRAGTENPAAIIGMAFALDKCYRTLDAKNAHLRTLKERMYAGLRDVLPGVFVNGCMDPARSLPTVLNVTLPCGDVDCMLLFSLDLAGISASGGSACNSGANQGSHVLRGIQAPPVALNNSVRFSFGVQNTEEEIDYTVSKLAEMVRSQVPA